jgi:hypothetical protein
MTTRRLRWAAAAPLAALTLFGVAACGSGSSTAAADGKSHGDAPADGTAPAAPATGAPGTGTAPGQGGAGRHHDMTTPPPGVSQASWDAARTACASLAPAHPSAGATPSTTGS